VALLQHSEMHTTYRCQYQIQFWFVVFNATFNTITVISRGGQFYWWRKPE